MSYCTRCGNQLAPSARVCGVCFLPKVAAVQAAPPPPTAAQATAQWPAVSVAQPAPMFAAAPVNDPGAIASLVLGIVGVLLSWAGVLFVGVSIAAIVVAKRSERRIAADPGLKGFPMARAGWWLGVVGTVFASIMTLAILATVAR